MMALHDQVYITGPTKQVHRTLHADLLDRRFAMSDRIFKGARRGAPSPRQQDALRAIDAIAGWFSRPGAADATSDVQDGDRRAVEVYLIRRSLGWSFSRITRRVGVSLIHAIRIYPRGRRLVAVAVERGDITPEDVAALLPAEVFF
jgi:hypothetical protein